MAKQNIGVGSTANDGTGDPLRNAMVKINANFTELYDGQFDGAYASLTGGPTSLLYWVNDGTAGQVITTDGSGVLTFQDQAAGYTNSNVDTHLNTSTAANNQILSWDGADYDWIDAGSGSGGLSNTEVINVVTSSDLDMGTNKILFSNVYAAEGDLPSASSYHGMFAHVHGTGAAYYAHNGAWVQLANNSDIGGGGGGSLQSRTSPSGSTASLANNASGDLDLTGFKSYSLFTITTDRAAWVRIYANGATRTADNSRGEGTDPTPDAGVIAEVITTGAETVIVSPGVIGFNLEATPTTSIPCRVTNKSGSTSAVLVTLNILQLEA